MADIGFLGSLSPYTLRAIIAIFLLAINAALSGSFTVFKDVSFLVAGAAHAALAGAAFAIVLSMYGIISFNPLIGGIAFAALTALAAGYSSRKGSKEQVNTSIGIAFAMSMSLAVLFISLIREQAARVWGLLFGDLLLLTNQDIALMASITILLIIFSVLFYREFIFVSFDMEGAMAYGIKAQYFNYLILLLIAVSSVVILKGVGAILVFAMLVAPAAAANEVARGIMRIIFLSFFIALLSGFTGILLSFFFPVSPGAVAALIATSLYFLITLIKR